MATNDAKKVFSLDEIISNVADGKRYKAVPAHGGVFQIGTLSTAAIVDWQEMRKDPNGKLDASMFILAKSLVFGDLEHPESLTRVPEDKIRSVMEAFKEKDDDENGVIVNEILKLNKLLKADGGDTPERGNGSGEATSAASPTA